MDSGRTPTSDLQPETSKSVSALQLESAIRAEAIAANALSISAQSLAKSRDARRNNQISKAISIAALIIAIVTAMWNVFIWLHPQPG